MIEDFIRDVPDFPKQGILFKDITPLLQSPEGLRQSIDGLAAVVDPSSYDVVCGIESRGFIFGTALASKLGKGLSRSENPASCPGRRRPNPTSSSMGPTRSRSTPTLRRAPSAF